jgi:adenosine deaminase
MDGIVDVIKGSSKLPQYPLVMPQIFCLHTNLPYHINEETLKLAISRKDVVCAVDVAGSDKAYVERVEEFVRLFEMAKEAGLKTTAHLFETENGMDDRILPLLDRIGHGIQIPLRRPDLLKSISDRGQCLEVCPTSYLMTGTLGCLEEIRPVFDLCFDAGVDIAICTDNAGLHGINLPKEYENLITNDIISFDQLEQCQRNAFKHAFAWVSPRPPGDIIREGMGKQ